LPCTPIGVPAARVAGWWCADCGRRSACRPSFACRRSLACRQGSTCRRRAARHRDTAALLVPKSRAPPHLLPHGLALRRLCGLPFFVRPSCSPVHVVSTQGPGRNRVTLGGGPETLVLDKWSMPNRWLSARMGLVVGAAQSLD
jgi:hypothetical protein